MCNTAVARCVAQRQCAEVYLVVNASILNICDVCFLFPLGSLGTTDRHGEGCDTELCRVCAAQVSPTEVYLVVNAGCREKDLAHIGKHLDKFTVSAVAQQTHFAVHQRTTCGMGIFAAMPIELPENPQL